MLKRKPTHMRYPINFQQDSQDMARANPKYLSSLKSIGYRHFPADFEKYCTDVPAFHHGLEAAGITSCRSRGLMGTTSFSL